MNNNQELIKQVVDALEEARHMGGILARAYSSTAGGYGGKIRDISEQALTAAKELQERLEGESFFLWMCKGESPEAESAFVAHVLRGIIKIPDELTTRIIGAYLERTPTKENP